ncbi:hypothetical protein HAX54_011694 [Datura stramonium]|uniref:Uncharacterized protein n=1 Tax=Datura stramonium TaxID=4076 RepID=A0ABS8RX98_DATST|nr:hypothetical protein [Datura stramonium]
MQSVPVDQCPPIIEIQVFTKVNTATTVVPPNKTNAVTSGSNVMPNVASNKFVELQLVGTSTQHAEFKKGNGSIVFPLGMVKLMSCDVRGLNGLNKKEVKLLCNKLDVGLMRFLETRIKMNKARLAKRDHYYLP